MTFKHNKLKYGMSIYVETNYNMLIYSEIFEWSS